MGGGNGVHGIMVYCCGSYGCDVNAAKLELGHPQEVFHPHFHEESHKQISGPRNHQSQTWVSALIAAVGTFMDSQIPQEHAAAASLFMDLLTL